MAGRASQRGLTLIELMVALAVSGIVMTVVAGSFVTQQTVYLRQQQYAQAQQNARAALSVIQQYVRGAGWGFAQYVAQGLPPVGRCQAGSSDQCNNVDADGSADRLQVVSVSPDGFVLRSTLSQSSAGSITVPGGFPGHPLPADLYVGKKLLISGSCDSFTGPNASKSAADVVTITGVSGSGGSDPTTYSFSSTEQVSCSPGLYRDGFNLGLLSRAEFYIDRSEASPRLMLDTGDTAPQVLAYDIEDLQIQYGVDSPGLGVNNGDAPDIWCDDLTSCATGLADARANQERVVAVRIAIVARTREAMAGYVSTPLTVFDHEIPGEDGYRRWVYRTTLALRNVHLFSSGAGAGAEE